MRSFTLLVFIFFALPIFSQSKFKKNKHRPESSFKTLSQSRNFFLPNGFVPEEAYYRSYYIYLNEVDFRISDNFYGGIGIFPLAGVMTYSHLGYSKKIKDNVRLGGGTYFFHSPGIDRANNFSAVLPYFTMTEGTEDRYVHLFYSKFYLLTGEINSAPTDIIGTGFSWRFKKKWRFFYELIYLNANFDEEDFLMFNNIGVSWFFRSHKLDFGFSPIVGELEIFTRNFRSSTRVFPLPIFSYSLIF